MIKREIHRLLKGEVDSDIEYRSVRSLTKGELMKRIIQYCGFGCNTINEAKIIPELNEICWLFDEHCTRITELQDAAKDGKS